LYVGLKWFCCW